MDFLSRTEGGITERTEYTPAPEIDGREARLVAEKFRQLEGIRPMGLSKLIEARAREHPDAIALLAPERLPITYAGLWQQVQTLAHALAAAGATPWTSVATVLPNGLEAAISFLGVASHATCVPLNSALPAAEMRFYLEDTRARFVILDKNLDGPAREVARDLGLTVLEIEASSALPGRELAWLPVASEGKSCASSTTPNDVALILHTSGTTSKPKLVPLTHANLLASARNRVKGLALQPTDRCLNVMPLFHIHALVGVLLASLAAGSSVVCTRGFSEAAFLDWVEVFQPTWYSAVPTIHQAVASIADRYRSRLPLHHFRFIRSSSAPLSPVTLRRLESGTGAPVIEAYGMTEASGQVTSNPLPPGLRKPGSVGLPAGAEIAIMDDRGSLLRADDIGEVVIRGPGVMSGYGGQAGPNPSAFTNGWFRTGDLGRLDQDGYLFIAGRLKEIVNRGGEKVSPREVDEALLEHGEVAQAAAFGVPHPTLGEDLVAAVVRKSGSRIEVPALRQFLFARLAEHKVPSRIVFVDEIPKGATGKVQRSTLHERLSHLPERAFTAATTDTERAIESTLRAILCIDSMGVHDNFFALGGDSLKGMQAVAAINSEHGVDLAATAPFHHPTIAELAGIVDQAKAAEREEAADLRREIESMSNEDVERLLAEEEAVLVENSNRSGSSRPSSP